MTSDRNANEYNTTDSCSENEGGYGSLPLPEEHFVSDAAVEMSNLQVDTSTKISAARGTAEGYDDFLNFLESPASTTKQTIATRKSKSDDDDDDISWSDILEAKPSTKERDEKRSSKSPDYTAFLHMLNSSSETYYKDKVAKEAAYISFLEHFNSPEGEKARAANNKDAPLNHKDVAEIIWEDIVEGMKKGDAPPSWFDWRSWIGPSAGTAVLVEEEERKQPLLPQPEDDTLDDTLSSSSSNAHIV